MIRPTAFTATALVLVAASSTFASTSRADDVNVVPPTPAPVVVVQAAPSADTSRTYTQRTGPDLRIIGGGIVTFGISYGAAVAVAATSSHQGDGRLYVPILGPWMDFGDRGSCPQTGSCDRETANRVLIVADGVFQALGVLSIVGGLLFEREVTTTTTVATGPNVQITPVGYAHGGAGLAAVGTF